jgi:hypothetical protein
VGGVGADGERTDREFASEKCFRLHGGSVQDRAGQGERLFAPLGASNRVKQNLLGCGEDWRTLRA